MKSLNWPLMAALRFALALVVLILHVNIIQPLHWLAAIGSHINGFACVLAFLALSGVAIGESLGKGAAGFYGRRFDRIYPIYFACFLLSIAPFILGKAFIEFPIGDSAVMPSPVELIGNALFLQVLAVKPIATFAQNWSLAVEVLFYALAPLVLRLGLRFALGLTVASIAVYTLAPVPFAAGVSLLIPASLACFWLAGFGYRLSNGGQMWKLLLLVLPALFALGSPADGKFGPLVLFVAVAVVLWGHEVQMSKRVKKVALYLGEISYPLYACHVSVFYLTYSLTGVSNIYVLLSASLIASIALYHLIDLPYRRRAKRLAAMRVKNTCRLGTAPHCPTRL